MEEIEVKIRKVIDNELREELYKNIDEIERNENLFNIGLDSLSIVKLIMGIEEEFKIVFEDDEIQAYNWKNIETIETLIKMKIRGEK